MPTRILSHPVLSHRLTELRDIHTDSASFRALLRVITSMLAYEAFSDLEVRPACVDTPVMRSAALPRVREEVLVVPILRAGLGMADALCDFLPEAAVAHVGMARDEETLEPRIYLDALPKDLSGRRVAVVDPMCATGGSLIAVCDMVAARGAAHIDALCVLASRDGVAAVERAQPEVHFYVAAVDDELNERGYIVPGLGDAGDRQFGIAPAQ